MKKTNIIQQALKQKDRKDNDIYEMIGAELKRKRTTQSKTLSYVAGDVCSVSYLCKVEKNQLKPNQWMLKEICKKLNIESPKMNILFELNELLDSCVRAFATNNMAVIEEIFHKCQTFDNYKSLLIQLIYHIKKYQFYEAQKIAQNLMKITKEMREKELTVFVAFFAILNFYEENYTEAIDNLLSLTAVGKDPSISMLMNYYLFLSYFKLNHPFTLKYGQILIETLFQSSLMKEIQWVRYYIGLYQAKNGFLTEAEEELRHLKNTEYYDSLKLILDLENHQLPKQNNNMNLRPFMKLVWIHLSKPDQYFDFLHQLSDHDEYSADYNRNLISYWALSTDEERFQEIVDVYIPNVMRTKNGYDRMFFLKELCRFSFQFGKYKAFAKAYLSLTEEVVNLI